MAFVEQQARNKQVQKIRLYTNERMAENLRSYQKLGFEEEGRRIQGRYHRVFLRKRLEWAATASNPICINTYHRKQDALTGTRTDETVKSNEAPEE